MCADIAVHPLGPDRLADFHAVLWRAFGHHVESESTAMFERLQRPLRALGALDGERLVATAAAFGFGLTVPGGEVRAAGVTAVSVAGSHRRRGILRQLMAAQLDDVAARGEPVAVLTASESGIYRRFGYGIASFSERYELDSRRVVFREPAGEALELRLVGEGEAVRAVPALYDRWRRARPGALAVAPSWWEAVLGPVRTWAGGGRLFVTTCEPGPGHGGGFAAWAPTHRSGGDGFVADVRLLLADDPVVEARLWRHLVETDLCEGVRAELVPVDCPLRWWLTDPRQVHVTEHRDWLHARLLDVPEALAARRYRGDGELVVEVSDRFRPGSASDGRFALAVGGGEGRCERTGRRPDLELDVAELGSLWLGGVRAPVLARAGLLAERTAGAVARADALFDWPVAPYCPLHF